MEKVFIEDKQGNKVLPKTHVSAVFDDEGNDLGSHLGAFEDEVRGLVETPHQEYVTVATYASLPAQGSEDTIYRVSNYDGSQSQVNAAVYSEYAWNGSQYVFLCVKSQVGEVFDITVYNSNTKYADLASALGTNGANIPQSLQKGGMSVKFVQSSDNKYVQYRCMAQNFTTDVTQWQGVDEEPIAGSENLVNSKGIYNFSYDRFLYHVISSTNGDLYIADDKMNALAVFKNGHLITKNFNSGKVPSVGINEMFDLSFADDQGNSCFGVAGGEIFTKKFNSKKTPFINSNKNTQTSACSLMDESGNTVLYIDEFGDLFTKKFQSNRINQSWKGKGILFLGDSITEHGYYINGIKSELGCKTYNRGVSGTFVAKAESRTNSFVERVQLPTNNSETTTYVGMPQNDLVDLIVIFGGTNDFMHEDQTIGLGTFTQDIDITMFYGALKQLCIYFRTNYPKKPIALCTLLPSYANDSAMDYLINANGGLTERTMTKKDGVHTREEYNEAIRKVAEMYGCYLIDLHKNSALCAMDATQRNYFFLNGDGLHPSKNGGKIIGHYMADYILENIYSFNF